MKALSLTEPSRIELAKRIIQDAPCKCGVCYAEALLFGLKSRPAVASKADSEPAGDIPMEVSR